MIATKLYGGLGNQMFQYAAGISLAKRLGTTMTIDLTWFESKEKAGTTTSRPYELGIFNLHSHIHHVNWLKRMLSWQSPLKSYLEPHYSFDPAFTSLPDGTQLDGYWQSERYFNDVEATIREDFQFPAIHDPKNIEHLKSIREGISVSMHVRRGDYIANRATNEFHGVAGLDYYREAVQLMEKRVGKARYFVFSDDPAWCRDNLPIPTGGVFVRNNSGSTSYRDMQLMSACSHNIIANSSFSWWGAWLNNNPNKTVIAPKKWFNDESIDTADLIPDSWIKQ